MDRTFYHSVPTQFIKNNLKVIYNFCSLKVNKKVHGDGVKNESTRAKKLEWLSPTPPLPPTCLGLSLQNHLLQ